MLVRLVVGEPGTFWLLCMFLSNVFDENQICRLYQAIATKVSKKGRVLRTYIRRPTIPGLDSS